MKRCSKNIHIKLPVLDNEIDFGQLIASGYFKTGMIVDNCGNPRIIFLPDPCVSLTGEEECDENPLLTVIKGSVEIECDLFVKNLKVDNLSGNGCNLVNTDDTKVITFEYDSEEQIIVLEQQNTKKCLDADGEEIEQEVERFELPVDEFVKNTIIEDFAFGLVENIDDQEISEDDGDEDLLSILDSEGRIFTVDMSKYTNKDERYVAPGEYEATEDGIIELPYNIEVLNEDGEIEKVVIDISNALHSFDGIEYDKCAGTLTVTTNKGDVVEVTGLPTNISIEGEIPQDHFSGTIFYKIENKVMNVICDFAVNVLVGAKSTLGFLPIKLKRPTHVWLTSMHGTMYSRVGHVQITIAEDGEMQLNQWQIPERIQDSFCIIIDEINQELLDEYCD